MPKYTVLLADADGTLLDFHAAEGEAFRAVCAEMGIAPDDAKLAAYSRINDALWRAFERKEVTQAEIRVLRFSRFLDELGVERDVDAMAEGYVRALSLQAQEIAGARDFLREAAARVPVIIVTNGIASVQRSRFALSPLRRYVRDYVISGEAGFAKPDPRMIERALELAGVPGARALMLGDEPRSDIAAACAAGVDSCWYNPACRENDTPYKPTHEIRELGEALAWL